MSLSISVDGVDPPPVHMTPPHYIPPHTPHHLPPVPHYQPSPAPQVYHGYSPAPRHYSPTPGYGYTPAPPSYTYHHPAPAHPAHPAKPHYEGPPACSRNTSKTWCVQDSEYPQYEISHAIEYNYAGVASLYKDVLANTDNSVDR